MNVPRFVVGAGIGLLLAGSSLAAGVPSVPPQGAGRTMQGVVDSMHPVDHVVIINDRAYRLEDPYRLNGMPVPANSHRLRSGMKVKIELAPASGRRGEMAVVKSIEIEGSTDDTVTHRHE
jgi:hypothetical protein